LVTALILATGCVIPDHTITARQAVERMEAYVQQTIRAVPTPLRFSSRQADTDSGPGCVPPFHDSGSTGQISPSLTYAASTTSGDDAEAARVIRAVSAYWRAKNGTITTEKPGFLNLNPYGDEYRLFATYYPAVRRLEIGGALDDCIWLDGTPHPTGLP
jgi:hypothetical protein